MKKTLQLPCPISSPPLSEAFQKISSYTILSVPMTHQLWQPHSPVRPCWKWSGCTWTEQAFWGPLCPTSVESLLPEQCVHSPQWTHRGGLDLLLCSQGSPPQCWWYSPQWPACIRSRPGKRENCHSFWGCFLEKCLYSKAHAYNIKVLFSFLYERNRSVFSAGGKVKAIVCSVIISQQPEAGTLSEGHADTVKKATLSTMVFNGDHNLREQLPVIKKWSTYIISEHVGEESHHDAVLSRVFLTESTNCLHNHHL